MSLALGKNNVNAKQPIHLDASNHLLVNDSTNKAVLETIATNTANINVNVGDVEINVADLEALQATTNTTLAAILVDTDAADSSLNTIEAQSVLTASRLNNIQNRITANTDGTGDTLGQIASNILTKATSIQTAVELLDNAISGSEMQVDIVSSALPSGAATEATLAANEAHVGSIDGKITACNTGSISGTVAVSAVSGNVACTHASLPLPSGAATEATLSAAEVHLGHIQTAVELIDNAISGSEMQVDIVSSALPTGAATSTNQSALIGHVDNVETLLTTIDGRVDGLEALQGAANTDLAAIEVLLTAANTDHAANEALLITIDEDTNNIATSTAACATDLAALEVLQTATNSKLDDMIGHNDGVETLLTAIDGRVDGLETLQGAANTDLAAIEVLNTAIDQKLGDIETAVQLIDDAIHAEDAAHSSGQKGIPCLMVRQDSHADLAADGDYMIPTINANGEIRVTSSASGGATEAKQDDIESSLNSLIAANHTDLVALETTLTAIETDQAAIEVLLTAANTDHAANEALLITIDEDTNAIKDSTAAIATDAAAIEVLLTAANTDHAANEVLLTAIDQKLGDIETAVQAPQGAMTVDTIFSSAISAGSTGTSSSFTKAREVDKFAFSCVADTNGSYNAFVEASVDNTTFFSMNGGQSFNLAGNAQNFQDVGTSQIAAAFKFYRIVMANNHSSPQNFVVKVCH